MPMLSSAVHYDQRILSGGVPAYENIEGRGGNKSPSKGLLPRYKHLGKCDAVKGILRTRYDAVVLKMCEQGAMVPHCQ